MSERPVRDDGDLGAARDAGYARPPRSSSPRRAGARDGRRGRRRPAARARPRRTGRRPGSRRSPSRPGRAGPHAAPGGRGGRGTGRSRRPRTRSAPGRGSRPRRARASRARQRRGTGAARLPRPAAGRARTQARRRGRPASRASVATGALVRRGLRRARYSSVRLHVESTTASPPRPLRRARRQASRSIATRSRSSIGARWCETPASVSFMTRSGSGAGRSRRARSRQVQLGARRPRQPSCRTTSRAA